MSAAKLCPPADVTIGRSASALGVRTMKSSLFMKLLGAAFLIIVVTLIAVDGTVAGYAARTHLRNDPAIAELRRQIFAISLGAAIFALVIAYSVSRSLSHRVSS